MDHILELNLLPNTLINIFKKIRERKVLLFLGAGASVTNDKRFLGKDVIEHYEAHINSKFEIDDLIEFVDVLTETGNFDRIEFDSFINDLVKQISFEQHHKILINLPWYKIITTNFDLAIEKAYDSIDYHKKNLDLKVIHNKQEYNYLPSNNELLYIKLNGCISDRKKYPLVLSTENFKTSKQYHKLVLNSLRSISDNILFLSAGYSYSDIFAKNLLKNIDAYDFRNKRWLINIDPYVNENQLEYFTSKRICVVKSTLKEFIEAYSTWESELDESLIDAKGNYLYDFDNQKLTLDPKIFLRIDKSLVQLNNKYKFSFIDKTDFYLGNEPNYGIIIRNYDIVKTKKIDEVNEIIINILNDNNSKILPIIFLIGNFGTGKTTTTYRLINSLQQNHSCIAFEVIDYYSINENDIVDLINNIKAEYIIFYFNFVERDSVFNALLDFRSRISIHQIPNIKIVIIASIRENVLERIKIDKKISNKFELNIDSSLSSDEISQLLDNLRDCNLVEFKDKKSKLELIKKITTNYNSDTFITLLDLISGKHYMDLIDAYNHLPKIAQISLIYTALLHQYNILMPVGLLKSLVAKDWEVFRNEILEIDCKNILIQEESQLYNTGTDIFFKTKHPIIAKKLIDYILPNLDAQYKYFENICAKIEISPSSSRAIIDLLRIL